MVAVRVAKLDTILLSTSKNRPVSLQVLPVIYSVRGTHYFHTSYVNNLKFIKNNSHKDSVKTLLKLDNKLVTNEMNQMVYSRAIC